ncbi:hypothetical protein HaLaN_08345, partial [Haematococcus lacustris]
MTSSSRYPTIICSCSRTSPLWSLRCFMAQGGDPILQHHLQHAIVTHQAAEAPGVDEDVPSTAVAGG